MRRGIFKYLLIIKSSNKKTFYITKKYQFKLKKNIHFLRIRKLYQSRFLKIYNFFFNFENCIHIRLEEVIQTQSRYIILFSSLKPF